MKQFFKLLIIASISATLVSGAVAGWFFEPETPRINYCDDAGECGLNEGITQIKAGINDIEKERTFSQYVQDITIYVLMFVTIVAVLYIIYAGFQIMIGGGDEEKVKNGKNTIKYVLIGIVVMWLAYSIVAWLLNVLRLSTTV